MASHNQNVFVGISLQNKGLKSEDYRKIVELAMSQFNFRKLTFLIADEIELINQRVFSGGSERTLRNRVEKMARVQEEVIAKACDGKAWRAGKIDTCRWVDILDSGYWRNFFEVERIFAQNPVLFGDVRYAIEEYAQRRQKFFSDAETLYLCSYVLHEIPTLLHGIRVKGKHYNSMIYPAPRNASIDKICANLISEKYSMTFFEPPFCLIQRYELVL